MKTRRDVHFRFTNAIEGIVPESRLDFAKLFWEHYQRVYRYIRFRINDEVVAEDLTSEVFERAFRYRDSYDPTRSAFSTWLGRLTQNWVSNYLTHQQFRHRHEMPLDRDSEHLASGDSMLEDTIIHQEDMETMLACLEQLGERDRQVVALRFGSNLRNKQIAELMGLQENLVGVILFRALERLRACQDKS
ncbi:MAG: sigma-70 family RNA polymerase sigma factor [Aggregatilineales bacterium]